MKCPNCGSDVSEGARFCDTCGAPISTTVPDTSISDVNISNTAASEPAVPDAGFSEASVPNTDVTDSSGSDTGVPDYTIPDSTPVPGESDAASSIPSPSPLYEPEIPVQPVEPAPERVLHYEVVTPEPINPDVKSSSMGTVSLVLGIIGIALSCLGCGGIFSVISMIVGYLSLKTTTRQTGIIGMILGGIGLIVSIIFACIIVIALIAFNTHSVNRGY